MHQNSLKKFNFQIKQDSKDLNPRPLTNASKTFDYTNAPKTFNSTNAPKTFNSNNAPKTLNLQMQL